MLLDFIKKLFRFIENLSEREINFIAMFVVLVTMVVCAVLKSLLPFAVLIAICVIMLVRLSK